MKSAKIKIYLLVSILAILAFSYFGTKIFIGNILPVIAQTSQPGVGGGALCVGANGAGVAVVGGAGTTCSPKASFDISTSSTSNGVLFRVATSSSAAAIFSVSTSGVSFSSNTTSISNNLTVNNSLTIGGTGSISTTTGITGLFIPAGWVSAGAFGSNTSGGNYSFPGILAVNTTSATTDSYGSKLQVNGTSTFNLPNNSTVLITGVGQQNIIGFFNNTTPLASIETASNWLYLGAGNLANSLMIDPNGTTYIQKNLTIGGTSSSTATLWVTNASSTNALVVASSGNVGIGTATPSYTLDVNGTIRAQSGLIIPAVTSDPSSPVNGQIWLRTDI